jgi:hypothetical protein
MGQQYRIFPNGYQWQTSKKRIFSLEQENGLIEGQANLKAYITKFYKDLFGEPEVNSFT